MGYLVTLLLKEPIMHGLTQSLRDTRNCATAAAVLYNSTDYERPCKHAPPYASVKLYWFLRYPELLEPPFRGGRFAPPIMSDTTFSRFLGSVNMILALF